MNKKGFSIVYILLAVVVLFVIVQFAFNKYSKAIDASTTSSVSVSVKKSHKSFAKTQTPKGVKKGAAARKGENAIMSQIMRKLSLIAVSQEMYFKKHSHYAKNVKDLEINQGIFTLPGYEIGLDDNKDGWSVWAKKTKEKNGVKTFYIGKNSKTKQICCQDIDKGSCEAFSLSKVTCDSKGWTLDLKK